MFNPDKHYLGTLCGRGHDWEGTGQSLRLLSNKSCRECSIARVEQWKIDNPERNSKRKLEWQKENKDKRKVICKRYYERRMKENPLFRLNKCMSSAVYEVLKLRKGRKKWQKWVGYTLEGLKAHLESLFTPEMTWDNYGSYWHVDHILPLSLFDQDGASDKEFRRCWALSNLRPLEAQKNYSKNCKLELIQQTI